MFNGNRTRRQKRVYGIKSHEVSVTPPHVCHRMTYDIDNISRFQINCQLILSANIINQRKHYQSKKTLPMKENITRPSMLLFSLDVYILELTFMILLSLFLYPPDIHLTRSLYATLLAPRA